MSQTTNRGTRTVPSRTATPPPVAPGAGRRSLTGAIAALSVAALLLALVVRSPHSEPLLLGVGVSGLLALRLLAATPRHRSHRAVALTPFTRRTTC